jgi:hypothetical protein
MRQLGFGVALVMATTPHVVSAQNIPVTIPQAEAEGAGFVHDDSLSTRQPYFAESPFGGTSERRCVSDSLPDLSLRSGDFIVRGRVFEAGVEHKVLWIPLHGSALSKPLVVRAARVDSAADSVRLRVGGLARSLFRAGPLYGYPSLVSLPSGGRWLVVATAGGDWGCFVLDVRPRAKPASGFDGAVRGMD